MKREYYREYYKIERNHWWFKVRNKILIEHASSLFNSKDIQILNIGAATGKTSELLGEIGKVTTLEIDKESCEFLREELNINAIEGSITNLPFEDNSFDLVCAFDVIEHVEEDNTAVSEMTRVCKGGGKIFITVPALKILWSHHDVVNQHFRRYSLNNLVKLVNQTAGGQILYSTYFNFFLFPLILLFRLFSSAPKSSNEDEHGSDFSHFQNDTLSNIFHAIFSLEENLLAKKLRLPIGVSLLLSWKKDDN